jgi:hypothetical protein
VNRSTKFGGANNRKRKNRGEDFPSPRFFVYARKIRSLCSLFLPRVSPAANLTQQTVESGECAEFEPLPRDCFECAAKDGQTGLLVF